MTRLRSTLIASTLLCCLVVFPAAAQNPLFLVNEETTVRNVSFDFVDTQTFDESRLKEQVATEGPTFWDRVRSIPPISNLFAPNTYPFDPLTLQRDVVRLHRFYNRQGFLHPEIDYPDSRLDTTSNSIHVIFSIREGPPLAIQDVAFYGADTTSYAVSEFSGRLRDEWIRFRDETSFRRGERYTDTRRTQIESQVTSWLQNRSFAFAQVNTQTQVDSTVNTVDIRFLIDPGPRARFGEISVEGAESIRPSVVRRELPFKEGDPFTERALVRGQRELFGLNVFRLALVDVPQQQRDSTVDVRVRVRESRLRYITAETGYAREGGLTAEGTWNHRNFLGGGRNLSIGLTTNSGLLASPPQPYMGLTRLFRGSVSLRQPYLFVTNLSAIVEPFLQFERNPLLEENEDAFLNLNASEYGVNTTLLYEILPFRTVTLQHTFSRASGTTRRFGVDTDTTGLGQLTRDLYNKNILTLGATVGQTDDRLNPSRGWLARPVAEFGGPMRLSGVEYAKLGGELTGYMPLTDVTSLTARLAGGRIWPFGVSTFQFEDSRIENRFDPIRFYTGGPSDVRGWGSQLAGPKYNRTAFVRDGSGDIRFPEDCTPGEPDCLPLTTDERYEALGGLSKLAANVELRLPFPGLGSEWLTAVFFDVGQVSARQVQQRSECSNPLRCDQADLFEDEGHLRLAPDAFKYGVGAGIRYRTPVGFARLDLAYKLNPDRKDLIGPRNALLEETSWPGKPDDFDPQTRFWRRFNLHLSIGQAF